MFEIFRPGAVAIIWNGCAGEIESPSRRIGNHLDRAGIVDVGGRGRSHQRSNLHPRVLHDLNQPGDVLRPSHGFIALDVQVNIGGHGLRHFVHPLRAAAMRGGGHLGLPAVTLAGLHDFIGISGDDHVIEQSSAVNRLVDPANQEFSGNLAQRFARQPGGGETGGDDGDDSHGLWLSHDIHLRPAVDAWETHPAQSSWRTGSSPVEHRPFPDRRGRPSSMELRLFTSQ